MCNKFKLELPEQSYISDGSILWIIFSDEKEMQIMSIEDGLGTANLSPIQVLQHYCSNDFLSHNMGPNLEDGRQVEHLEFTPHDKNEDLFKIRISYDADKKEIYKVKSFNKDGSRMTLIANNYNFTPSVSSSTFQCNTADFDDYHIEDLR
jgi:outer membrane lipoprotein-sorting protein